MNAPSEDIKDILEAESSLTLTFATNLFVSEIPVDAPVNSVCVSVFDTGGEDPEMNYTYERPHVQVLVRGAKSGYREGHELAQAIRDSLIATYDYEVNGARYVGIWCMGDVNFIAYDDNRRPLFTVNFRLHRTTA